VLALKWALLVAKKGNADAQFLSAQIYRQSAKIKQDFPQALNWYNKAAEQNHAQAQYQLAALYAKGDGVEQDIDRAIHLYQEAANQGNSDARYHLALLLLTGDGIDKDSEKALLMLLNLSTQEHALAQYQLYKIYNQGEIVNRDETLAKVYLRRASEAGDYIAQFQLGRLYQEKQLFQDAVKWLSLSAQQNYIPAKSLLAEVKLVADKISEERGNSDNTEVLESNDEDLETSQIQPEPTLLLLNTTVDESGLNLIPDESQIARSLADNTKGVENVKKLVISAKQGNPIAQHNLSTLFSIGALVPKDNRKAFMLMQEAAKQGLTQSQNSLSMMYINGIGVEPDYQSAYFWASASARQGDQEGKRILLNLISITQ